MPTPARPRRRGNCQRTKSQRAMSRDLCPNVGAAAVVVTPDNTGTTGSGARELAGWMAGWVVDGSGVKRVKEGWGSQ